MLSDPLLYSDELEEAELDGLRLMLLDKSIMVEGPLSTDCWIWTGGLGGPGYGHIRWPASSIEDNTKDGIGPIGH